MLLKHRKMKWLSSSPGERLWVRLEMKQRSFCLGLFGAYAPILSLQQICVWHLERKIFLCPALHLTFSDHYASLLSLSPTLIFNTQISEELLNIWLNAAIFIGALAERGRSHAGVLLAQRQQIQEWCCQERDVPSPAFVLRQGCRRSEGAGHAVHRACPLCRLVSVCERFCSVTSATAVGHRETAQLLGTPRSGPRATSGL